MDKNILQDQINRIRAQRLLQGFDARKYAAWAVDLIQAGYESGNIYILAGVDFDDCETVDPYFQLVADELQLRTDIEEEQLIRIYSLDIAERVIEGRTDPEHGVRLMYNIMLHLDYDRDYAVFMELDDALSALEYNEYPYSYPLTKSNKTDRILKEFKLFLEEAKDKILNHD